MIAPHTISVKYQIEEGLVTIYTILILINQMYLIWHSLGVNAYFQIYLHLSNIHVLSKIHTKCVLRLVIINVELKSWMGIITSGIQNPRSNILTSHIQGRTMGD